MRIEASEKVPRNGHPTPPFEQRSGYLIPIVLGLAATPIAIPTQWDFQLSPADLVALGLLPFVVFGKQKPREFGLLVFGILASLFGLVVMAIIDGSLYGPILTLAFFWKSWIVYFAALLWLRSQPSQNTALKRVLVSLSLGIALGMVLIGLAWRDSGNLIEYIKRPGREAALGFTAGSPESPLPLYGWGQVNNTAALLVIGLAVFVALFGNSRGWVRVYAGLGAAASIGIIVPSGSRGALSALFAYFIVMVLVQLSKGRKISLSGLLLAAGVTLGMVVYIPDILLANPKYVDTIRYLGSGEVLASDLTAGRSDLAKIMLADVGRSPLIGTGFGDFARFHPQGGSELIENSPHNTYLGPLHKGGILVAMPYMALIWCTFPFRRRSSSTRFSPLQWPLLASCGLVLFVVTDLLTTPVCAAALLSICAALRAHELRSSQSERHHV